MATQQGLTEDELARAVGDASLAEALVSGLARGLAVSTRPDRDPLTVATAAVEAITLDVAGNPTIGLLEALIRDDAELTDDDVTVCLEFVYSHMVSKFQGLIAECLAVPVCADVMTAWTDSGRLPASVSMILGADLRQRRGVEGGWFHGADALFVADEPGDARPLVILGVVEVKSRRRRAILQARRHIARLAYGIRIYGEEWPALRLQPRALRMLLVTPRGRKPAPEPSWQGGAYAVTLPCTRERLAAAAYAMTVWFIERLGARVFAASPSPWPEMTPEEAGINAVKQALYYTLLRPQLSLRAEKIAARLYNVYGFGYDAASDHSAMMWSVGGEVVSDAPNPTAAPRAPSVDDLVDRAWASYRCGDLDAALRDVDRAAALQPEDRISRRLDWLRAMIHYFRAEFDEAVRALPLATPGARDVAWAKDRFTMARALTRLGRLDAARHELDAVATASLPARLVPIGLAICEGLIGLKRGGVEAGHERLLAARALLRTEAAELTARASARLGLHRAWALDTADIASLAVDMLPGFVAVGDFEGAVELLTLANRVFPAYRTLVVQDPELEPLRLHARAAPALAEWLRRNTTET